MTSTLRKRDLKRCCAEGSSRAVRARHQAFKRNDGHACRELETSLRLMVNPDVLQSVRRVGLPGPVVPFLATELESNKRRYGDCNTKERPLRRPLSNRPIRRFATDWCQRNTSARIGYFSSQDRNGSWCKREWRALV